MQYIVIDGSMGEGGGQVLRTSLTLSMLYQIPIEIKNIRAGRNKPGLLRQHLTCVLAAAEIASAEVDGAELGATRLRFKPNTVKAGQYHFAIGTAGSTTLVCQTILLPLALTGENSTVTFEGGTHNMAAPSLTFLTHSFLSLLAAQGLQTQVTVDRLGFYPAGGGRWQLAINGVNALKPLQVCRERPNNHASLSTIKPTHDAVAMLSNLTTSIGLRELEQLEALLTKINTKYFIEHQPFIQCAVDQVDANGPGNMLLLKVPSECHTHVFEMAGAYDMRAEVVAKRVAGRYRKFCAAQAEVEHYLADQLLLPLLVGGSGVFCTSAPSGHLQTNVELIRMITGKPLTLQPIEPSPFGEPRWQVALAVPK